MTEKQGRLDEKRVTEYCNIFGPPTTRLRQWQGRRVETINIERNNQMRMWYQGVASNNVSVMENMRLHGYRGKRQTLPNSEWSPKREAAVPPCRKESGKQGSIEAFAKTKMVYRPVKATRQDGTPILDKNGKQVIWFNKMGLQNIVQITSYGKTFVFKKMQKAQTIRDLRDNKSHQPLKVRDELTRLLGIARGMKGYEFLMRVSVAK